MPNRCLLDTIQPPKSATPPRDQTPATTEPQSGAAFETRTQKEADLVATMQAQGKGGQEIQAALDGLRQQRGTGGSHELARVSNPDTKLGQNNIPPDATGRTRPAAPVPDLKVPNNRHMPSRVTLNSHRELKNTMIVPGTDIGPDLQAIREGRALRDGNYYVVGQRYYLMHPETHQVFPVSGPGLVMVDRQSYIAIAMYNKFGFTPQAELYMNKARISQRQRLAARIAMGQQ